MTRHHLVMQKPGVYRIQRAPEPLLQRIRRFIFGPCRRPEPVRTAPTLAQTGHDFVETINVSLAALRRARPGGSL